MTVEKTDRSSCVGVGKLERSRAAFRCMKRKYDTKEKSDPRNTNRFLLSHGNLSGFRVSGTAWTFSGTVHVDSPWDDSPGEDLVEIARSKFVEAKGARERPDAIEYLSVHCDLSPLILGSPSEPESEAQNVPVC